MTKAKEKGMKVKRDLDAAANQQITYELDQEATRTEQL